MPPLLVLLSLLLAFGGSADASCSLQPPSVRIFDYTPANTIVAQLRPATGSSDIDVATTNSLMPGSLPFRLLANSSLLLTGSFGASNVMSVYCSDSNSALLVLTRVETDDQPPVWTRSEYVTSISEAQTVPYQLDVRPKADDADGPDSGQRLVYSILPGPYSHHFSLNNPEQWGMNISLVRRLDYETVQRLSLTLRVQDFNSSGVKVFEANATLTVTVTNVDDVNPTWLNCSGDPCYVRQLLSNSSAGARVLPPVRAVDGDFGSTVSIVYSILSQTPSDIVSIDSSTGDLTLARSLPRPQMYTVVLFAAQSDDASKKTEAKLQLNVLSTSYVPPVFDAASVNSSVTLQENGEVGQLVKVVRATGHLDAAITYSLMNFNDVFSIDATSGAIQVKVSLNFEARAAYAINVSASDSGGGRSFTIVAVKVENVNEFNPSFERGDYEFAAARRESGLAVGTVRAVDQDGNAVTYSIPDAEFRKLFAVGAKDGVVTLAAEGGGLPLQTYRFSVSASDGSRAATAAVSVSFDSALMEAPNAECRPTSCCLLLHVASCIAAAVVLLL